MADPDVTGRPPEEPVADAQRMSSTSEEARAAPSRPGWLAGAAILAFFVAFVLYMIYAV